MTELDDGQVKAFEKGYRSAQENEKADREELMGLLQGRIERVEDLKLSLDGVQDELRELGVAFEKLQRAAKEAATSLRTMAAIMGEVSYDEAHQIAEDLEGAAGVAE